MKKVHINASAPYDALIGSGLLQDAGNLLKSVCHSNRVVIVTDNIVDGFYGEKLKKSLEKENFFVLKFSIPNGENHKDFSTLENLLNFLAENHIRRNDTVIALGGGVVGDLAGFAAAIYLRGIAVVQMPTTLLAMVDSAIGGKTGIDLPAGKNLAGAFYQPKLVIADTETLQTLPPEQFSAGMGEAIKYGVIQKNRILKCIGQDDMEELVAECVTLKGFFVERDEFDRKGIREILNAGHTVGHAIEKCSGYTVPHGKAVALGLVTEARIAVDLGLADVSVYERIVQTAKNCDLYEKVPYLPEELAEAMQNDKKNRDTEITFVLPKKMGECVHKALTIQQVIQLLEKQ